MTIDIMMPFFGDPKLFREAVDSVLAQNDPDWRLVVVDDHYADEAPGAWVSALPDDRIRYVRNPANLGVARNFARSLELVEAEYFVMMGCDDLLASPYVASMHALIREHGTADYFQPGVTIIDDVGDQVNPLPDRIKRITRPRTSGTTVLSGEGLAASLLRGNWTYFPAICWRTETVRRYGFDPSFAVVVDLALQLRIVCGGGTLVVAPAPLFRYRRHDQSVSSWAARDGSRFDEERAFFRAQRRVMLDSGWRRAARVAHLHLSSRLNAATKVPGALLHADGARARSFTRHVFAS